MGRILAIDYGKKRTGLAVTDELQLIASGLTTVETPNLINYLKEYIESETVETLVIGLPKQMDNTDSESELLIGPFIEKIKTIFPDKKIVRIDERFTSKLAFSAMIEGGLGKKKRRNKALVDQISATIILQSYLEQKSNL